MEIIQGHATLKPIFELYWDDFLDAHDEQDPEWISWTAFPYDVL